MGGHEGVSRSAGSVPFRRQPVRPRRTAWIVVALGLAAGPAAAQSGAAGGLRGLLQVRAADTHGKGFMDLGVFGSGHSLLDDDGSRHYFSLTDFQLGYGLSPYLDVGLSVPLRAWSVSRSPSSTIESTRLLGFGDLVVSGTLQLPLPWQRFRVGGFGGASLPTGSRSRGMSSEVTDVELGGLLTLDFSNLQRFVPLRVHLNGIYRWNRNEVRGVGMAPLDSLRSGGFWPPAYPGVPAGEAVQWNDQLLLRGGLEFITRPLDLFTEFSVDMLPRSAHLQFGELPLLLTQGALVKFRNGLGVKLAAAVSLQDDDPAPEVARLPDWRLTLGVTWRLGLARGDRDQDGLGDAQDACPDEAEDFDGFQDQDGCPDLDNDQDGVPDAKDLAPDLPEDLDGFEDDDGRPDRDNDADGIPDAQDQCPNEPEDFDGDRDTDGCPDLQRDSDGDGIEDGRDRCHDVPEDKDGVDDDDGCPEPESPQGAAP